MLTDQQKNERAEKQMLETMGPVRPGIKQPEKQTSMKFEKYSIDLSDIQQKKIKDLKKNKLNDYISLSENELQELSTDIKSKGILIPLIISNENIIICGHNRLLAATRAGFNKVPCQVVLSKLNRSITLEIMKSENERRRGSNWTPLQKKEYIEKHFSKEISKSTKGGDTKKKRNIAKEIERKTKGIIPKGTADRLISDIKNKKQTSMKFEKKAGIYIEVPEKYLNIYYKNQKLMQKKVIKLLKKLMLG